jgi:hypothetical protein
MSAQTASSALSEHVLYLLQGGGAHANFETATAGIPAALRGRRPKGAAHSPWAILEHMRIAQWDILEFSRNAKHVSPPWPEGCWPANPAPPRATSWQDSIKAFRRDLKTMQRLVANPRSRLFTRIPHGDGQTLLREALLIADHNAYHLGELLVVRRLLGVWK